MFSEFIAATTQLLQNNQFLVGGIGTLVLGGVAYFLRSVPHTLYLYFKRLFTCEFIINTDNFLFYDVLHALGRHRFNFLDRTFSVDRSGGVIPGYGLSFAFYRGRLVVYTRHMLEKQTYELAEQINITMFTRKRDLIESFLNESKNKGDESLRFYFTNDDYWEAGKDKRKRKLDTIFLDKEVKQRIVDRVTWFTKNEKWYTDRGIPYKQCLMLHGVPGTGKTSFIHAIASHLNRNIRFISELTHIDTLLSQINPLEDLVVIEDIDTMSTKLARKDGPAPETSVLHKLLNTFDGFKTPHGLLIIMTTNHLEKLDPAVIRKGRIDELIEITPVGIDALRDMFAAFYGEDCVDLLERYLEKHTYNPVVGSHLQELFMSYGPREALDILEKENGICRQEAIRGTRKRKDSTSELPGGSNRPEHEPV